MDLASLRHLLLRAGIRFDDSQSNQRKIVGFCPFAPWKHKSGIDRRPSFAAFECLDKNSYYVCKACGMKGPLSTMFGSLHSLSGEQKYHELYFDTLRLEGTKRMLGEFEDSSAFEEPPQPLNAAIYDGLFPAAYSVTDGANYLQKRGISAQTAENLGILYDPDQRRVLFPVYDLDGGFYGFTGRATHEDTNIKVRDYAGLKKKWLILGCEHWQQGKPVIIVEGLFAYAHLHEIGIAEHANIGAIMGNDMTRQKADILIRFDEPTFLILDNDDGGDTGLFGDKPEEKGGACHKLYGHVPLFVPAWPTGKPDAAGNPQQDVEKDDPDQLTREEVMDMITKSPPFSWPKELDKKKNTNYKD